MAAEILPEPRGEVRRDRLKLVEPIEAAPKVAEARRTGETEAEAPATSQPPSRGRMARRAGIGMIGMVAIGAGLWFGADWWFNGRFIVSTDDAYVGAEMATISAKLSANVVGVSVRQNQEVTAGQPLVALDDGDWRIALDSDRAKTATGMATLARIDSQIEAGQASLQQAQAQEVSAQAGVTRTIADFERANSLAAKSYGSQATLDAATAARDQAKASLGSAVAGVTAAQANIDVLKAQRVEAARQVEELKIAERKAERDLSFTRVAAPISGLVANTNVQLGDLVSAGKRLMSIVPLD
ncbi:MAG: biotin/lipoyl-binding protein, partial [Bosea sp. (in: a-proteobacteria)]|nr:biotin/lipoyl-binding protein [Bosea sp. (in: a-proteobacteria)]